MLFPPVPLTGGMIAPREGRNPHGEQVQRSENEGLDRVPELVREHGSGIRRVEDEHPERNAVVPGPFRPDDGSHPLMGRFAVNQKEYKPN